MLRSHYQHYPRGVAFHRQHYKYVGALAGGVLLLLGYLLLCPPTLGQGANALDNTSTSASSRLSVKAVETVSVRLASTVSLELEPHSQGSFGVAQTELGVTTNDPEGFEVFLATTDREAALRGATGQIDTIQQDTVGTSFSGNTWGYSIGKNVIDQSTTYHTLPTTNSSILKTERATVEMEDVYQLGFGVHITPSLPAGEYSTSVVLSVVANPATISNLQDLVYMQDMTAEICSNTYPTSTDLLTMSDTEKEDAKLHPITKRLYDIRDGKKYWVAKLADGNCWMTQNLALDLDTNAEGNAVAVSENGNKVELNSLNTDIATVWHDYAPTKTEREIPEELTDDYTVARSWNLGKVVLSNINMSDDVSCSDIPIGGNITDCARFTNVSGWVDTFVGNERTLLNVAEKSYDAHYLIGNYYQWSTATAGSGFELVSPTESNTNPDKLLNAENSICPNGWKMPTTGRNRLENWPYDLEDSFYQLLRAYGYPETGSSSDTDVNEWLNLYSGYTAIYSASRTNVGYSPIYFVRNGSIESGKIANITDLAGYLNSSTASTSTTASYNVRIRRYHLFPALDVSRQTGTSIRCLAR